MSLLTSQDDIRNLRPIVSYCNPNPPNEVPLLHHMLRLCRRKLARDFLFTSSPAHLTIMTSPSFKESAIALSHEEITIAPKPLSEFQLSQGCATSIIVPAFTAENISVGFGVAEINFAESCIQNDTRAGNGFWGEDLYQFRYACDTTDGSYVAVKHTDSEFHISCVVKVSSTWRRRIGVRLSRKEFGQILFCGSEPEDQQILSALKHGVVMDEYRSCPSCRSLPSQSCTCPKDCLAPQHPLDFSNVPKIVSLHCGSFEAIARFSTYAEGTVLTQNARGVRTSMEGIAAPGLVNRLTQWAVTSHLRGITQFPTASIIPDATVSDAGEQNRNCLVSCRDVEESFLDEKLNILDFECSGTTPWDFASFSAVTTAHAEIKGSTQDSCDKSEAQYLEPGAEALGSNPVASVSTAINLHGSTSWATDSANGNHQMRDCTVTGSKASVDTTTLCQNDTSVEKIASRVIGTSFRRRRRVSPDDPEEIKRREEYRIMRREKNRASARKSNLKRKMENDSRRKELQLLREMEEALREKERDLRMQNIRLRHAVTISR